MTLPHLSRHARAGDREEYHFEQMPYCTGFQPLSHGCSWSRDFLERLSDPQRRNPEKRTIHKSIKNPRLRTKEKKSFIFGQSLPCAAMQFHCLFLWAVGHQNQISCNKQQFHSNFYQTRYELLSINYTTILLLNRIQCLYVHVSLVARFLPKQHLMIYDFP